MSKKTKIIILCVALFLLVASIATCLVLEHQRKLAEAEAERLRIYHETYLVMDGAEYLRSSTELDLSNQQITEIEKLQELTKLQQLNLRGTGITAEQYDMLAAALPECEILWSVPFQGAYCDNTAQELVLETLSEEDIAVLAYLPELVSIKADDCRDYDQLFQLMETYPDVTVSCSVPLGDVVVPYDTESITLTDPDAAELLTKLRYLPRLTAVTLEGTVPDQDAMILLKETYPNITFLWNFSVCGVETNSLAEFIDLSKIHMDNTEELEAALPCFYNLAKVDMISCGLSNEDMDALNKRHPGTRFIWEVLVSGRKFRTDIRYFMPTKYKMRNLTRLDTLRYCKDIEVIDIGHYGLSDISFIEDMPKLRCLLLLDCPIRNISSISACTSLEFLEVAQTPISEYWLFTNLTNLKDLNLSATPFNSVTGYANGTNDITMMYQFTNLDRLWFCRTHVPKDQRARIHELLPDTIVMMDISECTGFGWRFSPRYFEHRDIMGMFYMAY
jgi:hypothetical protein